MVGLAHYNQISPTAGKIFVNCKDKIASLALIELMMTRKKGNDA